MAARWPERVEKVVIASSGVNLQRKDNDELLKRAKVEKIEELMLPATAGQLRTLMSLSVFRRTYMPDFLLNDFIDKWYTDNKKQKLELLKGLTLGLDDSVNISPLPQEVLVIWGERDKIFLLEKAHELKKLLGDKARLEVIKNTSHIPQLECAAKFNNIVKNFLRHWIVKFFPKSQKCRPTGFGSHFLLQLSPRNSDQHCNLSSPFPSLDRVHCSEIGRRELRFNAESMGSLCSRDQRNHQSDTEEKSRTAQIERQIDQETKAEKHIQKLVLLGAGDSGKSTIFKQIKLLFLSGFDEEELKSYIPIIHANVYETIKILLDGSKDLSQTEADSLKYVISDRNKEIGEKLSEICDRLEYPCLTKELAQEIEAFWRDDSIQETYSRGNELQIPDCAHYFMENLQRLSDRNYIPTKEDVLTARVRTTGVTQIQFSPVGENQKGEAYRLFDVGGQRNERRKWIHLFEGVTAVIFCAAISEYDQTLFEDDNKNRLMETKELFEWVLKQPCFKKTSFILFLNKFDLFEKKVLKVPLNVCEWFKDYQPVSTEKQEIEHAYEFVKKKFEELHIQSATPDCSDRVLKIYRTTALDQNLVKETFKLVDQTLRRKNSFETGLL